MVRSKWWPFIVALFWALVNNWVPNPWVRLIGWAVLETWALCIGYGLAVRAKPRHEKALHVALVVASLLAGGITYVAIFPPHRPTFSRLTGRDCTALVTDIERATVDSLPYEKDVVVQVSKEITPLCLVLDCDKVAGIVDFRMNSVPPDSFKMLRGFDTGIHEVMYVVVRYPVVRPDAPFVLRVAARSPFKIRHADCYQGAVPPPTIPKASLPTIPVRNALAAALLLGLVLGSNITFYLTHKRNSGNLES